MRFQTIVIKPVFWEDGRYKGMLVDYLPHKKALATALFAAGTIDDQFRSALVAAREHQGKLVIPEETVVFLHGHAPQTYQNLENLLKI